VCQAATVEASHTAFIQKPLACKSCVAIIKILRVFEVENGMDEMYAGRAENETCNSVQQRVKQVETALECRNWVQN